MLTVGNKLTRELLSFGPTLSPVGGAVRGAAKWATFLQCQVWEAEISPPSLKPEGHRSRGWNMLLRLALGAWHLVDKVHNPQVSGGFWVKGYLTFYYRSFFASGFVPQGGSLVLNDGCSLERGFAWWKTLWSVSKWSSVNETVLIGRSDTNRVSRAAT